MQLRRFSIGSVIRIALPLLAVFVLVSALAGFDLDEFVESLQDATWWLVLLGLIVAQLPRIAQAVSTLGAAPIPLPLGPVYALQLAISYVNLAIPTAAARIAVNIRFFQRQGVPPARRSPPARSTASAASSSRRSCSCRSCCSVRCRSTSISTTRRATRSASS